MAGLGEVKGVGANLGTDGTEDVDSKLTHWLSLVRGHSPLIEG